MSKVVVFPEPFNPKKIESSDYTGKTIEEIILDQPIERQCGPFIKAIIADSSNDYETFEVAKEDWATKTLDEGDLLIIAVKPKAAIGAAISGVFGAISSAIGSLTTAFSGLNGIGKTLLKVVGNALLGGLGSSPSSGFSQSQSAASEFSNTYSLQGASNQKRLYQPVERSYGRHKMFPSVAADYFTVSDGDSQTLYSLFCFGKGELELSDFRIGTTPIENFTDFEIQVRPGADDDEPITLYPAGVRTDSYNVFLQTNEPIVRKTRTNTSSVSVDFNFPRGIFEDYAKAAVTVAIKVEYKLDGEPDENYVLGNQFSESIQVNGLEFRNISFDVPNPGVYDLRITLTSSAPAEPSDKPNSVAYDIVMFQIKSISSNPDLVRLDNLALVALKIRATEQLNGVIDNFSAIVKAKVNVYDPDTETFSYEFSANPAWIVLDILLGTSNPTPTDLERIDLDAFVEWANVCDELVDGKARYEFNGIFDTPGTVEERAKTVASVGRASIDIIDGVYTIVQDITQTIPRQQFTPANSRNFSSKKVFLEDTHATRVRFINPEKDWQQDEIIVYQDGFNQANATKFTELQYLGVTGPNQAWRLGRYEQAVARLRPEIYTLETDFEHIAVTRGDLVLASHDVPAWGFYFGVITGITRNEDGTMITGIRVNDKCLFELGNTYAVSIRGINLITSHGVIGTGFTQDLLFLHPIPSNTADISIGNDYSFGVSDRQPRPLLVKSVRQINDTAARLTLVDYQTGVYEAENSNIPDFDTGIVPIPVVPLDSPLPPVISNIVSDDTALAILEDGSSAPRIRIIIQPQQDGVSVLRSSIQVRFRRVGTNRWTRLPTFSGEQTSFFIDNVVKGDFYDVSVRAISANSIASEWVTVENHEVLGQILNPLNPTSYNLESRVDGLSLSWQHPGGLFGTIVFFELRRGISWDDAEIIGTTTNNSFLFPTTDPQEQTILLRARNEANLYSQDTLSQTGAISRPQDVIGLQAVATQDNLDLRWNRVPGNGISYEIRQGNEWMESQVILSTSDNVARIVFPTREDQEYTFFVKALSAAGLYSEAASFATINIQPIPTRNIILDSDQKALGWPGSRNNFAVDGDGNLTTTSTFAEYIYPINLPNTYTSRNWQNITIGGAARNPLIIDDANFTFDSPLADIAIDGELDETGFNYESSIAFELTNLPTTLLESFTFNNTLVGAVSSTSPTVSENVSYQANRFHNGFFNDEDLKLTYTLPSFSTFNDSFTLQFKTEDLIRGNSMLILRQYGSGTQRLVLFYKNNVFYLLDENNNQLALEIQTQINGFYNIGIFQNSTTRYLAIEDVNAEQYYETSGQFPPIENLDRVSFNFFENDN